MSAAVINSARRLGRNLKDMKIVVNGDGAAGSAIARMLLSLGVGTVRVLNADGILRPDDESLDSARRTGRGKRIQTVRKGNLAQALVRSGRLYRGVGRQYRYIEMISRMAPNAAVFAMANPTPEIMPEEIEEGRGADNRNGTFGLSIRSIMFSLFRVYSRERFRQEPEESRKI